MFFLSQIEHTLRLPPHLLNRPLSDTIKEQLDSIFLDKVIDKVGLCVSVYDIRSINGGFIFPSDGASTYTVMFRLVMFRPFVGEVITARLKESTENGLRCINCLHVLVCFQLFIIYKCHYDHLVMVRRMHKNCSEEKFSIVDRENSYTNY